MQNAKVNLILKKTMFSGIIFVFETFLPILAGFEMIAALFIHYIIYSLIYVFGNSEFIEYISIGIFFVIGAAFIVLLHLLYHILIDGVFEISLLIEMNIELFAVFLFFSLPDVILEKIVRNYKAGDEIMALAKRMFLAAAILYALFLAILFLVRFLKKKKLAKKIKSLEEDVL